MTGHIVILFDLLPARLVSATDILDVGTAGVETTAGRWVGWVGEFAFEADRAQCQIGIDFGDRRKEGLGIRMLRALE